MEKKNFVACFEKFTEDLSIKTGADNKNSHSTLHFIYLTTHVASCTFKLEFLVSYTDVMMLCGYISYSHEQASI